MDNSIPTLKLYPNPISNSFVIANLSEEVAISVFNLNGQEVLRASNYSGEKEDVSSLSIGMYLVKVYSEKSQQTLKMIKTR